ncbi:MAG TPA: TonB-dependent receptor [Thermoanaerobaculia bacterium]|nr:TonB-dependent receptor [Thermoanaerobaculia bacterium]
MQRRFRILLVLAIVLSTVATAQTTGRIEGRVTRPSGAPLAGVIVSVNEISAATITDANGAFVLRVPPGSYSLLFSAGQETAVVGEIEVTAGQATTVNRQLDWNLSFAETITVFSASREAERIVEAPAAVSVVTPEEIESTAPTGQAPKLLEHATGVDYTQSGLYDINFNTRGFNSSLNRRILTLIDGRDPSVPFLGAQEWAAVSFPLDTMGSVELVRGPGSALYGANAFNGVLNMTTKQPRYDQGGKLTLTGGELATARGDVNHAGALEGDWFYRVVGGYQSSDDYTRSRNAGVEYGLCAPGTRAKNCLPFEAVPLALSENEIIYGGVRLDKYFENGPALTLEAGTASLEGPTFQTGIGRVQVTDVTRPWARFNVNTNHWNFLAFYDSRNADEQVALGSGALLYEDSSTMRGELQGNADFASGRGRVVGGVSYGQQDIDTSNPQGFHTLMAEAHDEDSQAVFGQVDFDVTSKLKVVAAARWDDSSLHDEQFSPKGSIVYSIHPDHNVRLTYNEAFQVPNYSEFFLRAPAGAPVRALFPIEQQLAPFLGGVSLGFNSIPILALGNDDLDVEEITSYEIGYSGIFGGRLYMTLDYYQNEIENFVTDLLPGPLVNPDFAPYRPPSVLPAQVQQIILGALQQNVPASTLALMTNLPDGSPAFVLSYTNAGKVDTEGAELSFNFYVNNNWILDFNYSWFDFEIVEAAPDLLLPNAPKTKFNAGVTYRWNRFDASLKYRWVDGFVWATGIFYGDVPSFDVLNFAASVNLTDAWRIGTNISNVLDSDHWESFGGDRLGRRALGYASVRW